MKYISSWSDDKGVNVSMDRNIVDLLYQQQKEKPGVSGLFASKNLAAVPLAIPGRQCYNIRVKRMRTPFSIASLGPVVKA